MRFRGMSIATAGAAMLLLACSAADAEAQRGRRGVLRPPPRPLVGLGPGRARWTTISPHFFTTCFVVPSFPIFSSFGGGLPFVNIQIFANGQPSPDPSSHPTPDPAAQPVPFPASHPLPGLQPVPGIPPVPAPVATNPHAVPAFAAPVYSAPVYSAPVYGPASPVATPQVSNGMVVGDVIVDPTFGLWGSSFFFGGGLTCVPTRFLGGAITVR